MSLSVLLLAVFFSNFAFAADLLWPLPGHKYITGGFGDSRPDHFHGGVDLRTSGANLPVVAPTDGWIERLAISPTGYGLTVYFRLKDERTAVFGHLSRFEPGLEKIIRDAQLVDGRWRVDLIFDEPSSDRTFRRGDVLAYSGESGIGPPHLHFELREGAVQVDPLAPFTSNDSAPPVIAGVWWTSLSDYSPLKSGKQVPLTKTTSGVWKGAAISANEPVALFVQTYDVTTWGRNWSPSKLRLLAGETVLYEDAAGRIDLQGPKNIYSRLVWPIREARKLDVRRVFTCPPPKGCAMVGNGRDGWIADVKNSAITLEVEDASGNISRVNLTVTAGPAVPADGRVPDTVLRAGQFTLSGAGEPGLGWASLTPLSSREVTIAPDDLAFGDRMKLSYAMQPGDTLPGLFFFERGAKGARRPLWRVPETGDLGTVSCFVMKAGTFGVAADFEPPTLLLSAEDNRIRFRLSDTASGIDDDRIRCLIDGKTAVPEFEYEEKGGLIWTRQPLAKGSHDVQFTAADRAGNERGWNATVTIP